MTEKLQVFTMPVSGVNVTYKPVSPALIALDVQASFPAPVYKQKVEYGDGQVGWEENRSHPEQERMTKDWEQEIELLTFKMVVLRSIVLTITDEVRGAINETRDEFSSLGITLDKSDKLVWFKHIACGSDADWKAFVEHLADRQTPKAERIAAFENTFRSNVPQS